MKPRKIASRMSPSTRAKSTVLAVCGAQWRSERAAAKGRNLYIKIKKPSESATLEAVAQLLISSFSPLAVFSSSRATSAE